MYICTLGCLSKKIQNGYICPWFANGRKIFNMMLLKNGLCKK